jgi:serine/threonine protein kinase
MKYNGKYTIQDAFLGEGSIRWNNTGNGEFVIGVRNGIEYFIKRNVNVRKPTVDLPKDVYSKLYESALWIESKQLALREKLSDLKATSDRIVIEEDHFWDVDQRFVTVTRKIPDATSDYAAFRKLGPAALIELVRKMTSLLDKLHKRKVIHGDIKEPNFLFVNSGGTWNPYLIDFDSSYLETNIPPWDRTTYSNGYQSPEIAVYTYDANMAPSSTITTASDIFSLGVVIHKLWTGRPPKSKTEKISPGEALCMGEALILDSKFNVEIGPKHRSTLMSLLHWMLQLDPAKRPQTFDILVALDDGKPIPETYRVGSDKALYDSLWETHQLIAKRAEDSQLNKLKVSSLMQKKDAEALKYAVVVDGESMLLSIDELCLRGYAIRYEAAVESPWPEHRIEFIHPKEIAALGYLSIRPLGMSFMKRYLIRKASGIQFDCSAQWLLDEGLARPIPDRSSRTDSPWPEHGKAYADASVLDKRNIKEISRFDDHGEHRYRIVYHDGTSNASVSVKNMNMMGLIRP